MYFLINYFMDEFVQLFSVHISIYRPMYVV